MQIKNAIKYNSLANEFGAENIRGIKYPRLKKAKNTIVVRFNILISFLFTSHSLLLKQLIVH